MDYESLLARAGILLRKPSTPKVWTGVDGAEGFIFSDRGAGIAAATLRGSPLYNPAWIAATASWNGTAKPSGRSGSSTPCWTRTAPATASSSQ